MKIFLVILVMTLVTYSLRALPFVFLNVLQNNPTLKFLSLMLPPCIMLILVVFSLADTNFKSYPHGMPEILASLGTAGLHLYKRNIILSVVAGTFMYLGAQHLFVV